MERKTQKWMKIHAISFLGLLSSLYLSLCTYAALAVTKQNNHKPLKPTPEDFGAKYENIIFRARNDGMKIAGWYMQNPASKSAIILVHGRFENRASAMSCTFPKLAAALHKAGFSVLMIDLRGHGKSETARCDFGLKSKNDVLGAVDWLTAQGFAPGQIGALGISIGGSAVNYAAAEEPAIGAIVGDSTYSDMKPVAEIIWQDEYGLPHFFLPGVFLMHRILMGFDIRDAVPLNAVREMEPRPIFFIHCKSDKIIPITQTKEMVAAMPGAESWIIDKGCEHAQIYPSIPEAYESRVISFFQKHLR
jgi:dipeptidyl aminopeptidase/acylaminoacyl peptidase